MHKYTLSGNKRLQAFNKQILFNTNIQHFEYKIKFQ